MNFKEAYELLEIDSCVLLTNQYLKKQYHKQALLYHPDKNGNTEESKVKFQRLSEAYDFLKRESKYRTRNDTHQTQQEEDEKEIAESNMYPDILGMFLNGFFDSPIFNELIKDILLKKLSLKLLESLDRETCVKIYNFLSKNKHTLHVSEDILNKIHEIMNKEEERKDTCKATSPSIATPVEKQVFNLNPSIDDLFNNNVYKLVVDEKTYIVPLWHSELYFDGNGCEIIVFCEPELDKECEIDEHNNIYIKVEISMKDIQDHFEGVGNGNKTFLLGKKEFSIPLHELYIKREQIYRIRQKGISKVKENNIYDIEDKADIIVRVLISI